MTQRPTRLMCGFFVLGLGMAVPVKAQDSGPSPKTVAIHEMLEVTGVAEQMILGMELAMEGEKASNPELPTVFFDRFMQAAKDNIGDFLDMLVPVYDSLATLEDIEAMTEYFRTPAGRRSLEIQEEAALQMVALSEQWGMILAGEVMVELAKEGVMIR